MGCPVKRGSPLFEIFGLTKTNRSKIKTKLIKLFGRIKYRLPVSVKIFMSKKTFTINRIHDLMNIG
jgi:hypothetical protein